MIIERQSNRRQREQIYRQQLFDQIQQKQQQKQLRNRSRVYEKPITQQFSLIKNIEAEQQKRKNKQKEYYQQLQRQRIQAIEYKKRKIEQERIKQAEMDEKIRKQNQMLKKRYQQELRKQNMKKQTPENVPQVQYLPNKINKKHHQPQQDKHYPKDILDHVEDTHQRSQHDHPQNTTNYLQNMDKLQSYPYLSRLQNQQFNFPQRKTVNYSYYSELLQQRRKLDQQTESLRDLNRMIHSDYANQRHKYQNTNQGGINHLKQISKLIIDQSQHYMKDASNYKKSSTTRSKTQNSVLANSTYYQF